jgi:hypothetical protein
MLSRQDKATSNIEIEPSTIELEAVQIFFNRRYWTRLWVVQEIPLPTNLIFCMGKRFMTWDKLFRLRSIRKALRLLNNGT